MKVILAETAGFCFGVQRAVDLVNKKIEEGASPIHTYGPIIHNEEVTRDFEKKGVYVLDEEKIKASAENALKENSNTEKSGNEESGAGSDKGTIVLRSHGVARAQKEYLEQAGYEIADATCPFVTKIHRAVEKFGKEGHFILIVGNDKHPEVEGIKGWCVGPYMVIEDKSDIDFDVLPKDKTITIVSQTTFRIEKFKELVDFIVKKGYNANVMDTICDATRKRQEEAAKIAQQVDVMFVIGGQSSSNTRKLYEICSGICKHTYFLQTAEDFDPTTLHSANSVGITAGASTPNHIIKEVQKLCQM